MGVVLNRGFRPARWNSTRRIRKLVADLNLLTDKPVLVRLQRRRKERRDGQRLATEAVREAIAGEQAEMLVIAAATEADIAELEDFDERQMFLEDLGLEESGVARLIKSAYKLLNLETFFTTGADETRAWTALRGMKAPQTAGIIHTDFEKGFIRAEVIKYDDYTALGSEKACAATPVKCGAKCRSEGKRLSMSSRTATSCTRSCSTSDAANRDRRQKMAIKGGRAWRDFPGYARNTTPTPGTVERTETKTTKTK